MPRSATDATRFTSTTPHASAIPSKALPPRAPGPPGETPQEKVKRLRAAADRAREAQVTSFDRLVLRGRVWADRAHKVTTLTLIGATVIAAGVTMYALGDMMVYNRRKRAQFFEEQKAKMQSALFTARQAIAQGTATPEQISFVTREEEHETQLLTKEKKKGMFARGKEWMFSGLRKDEGEGQEGDLPASAAARLGAEVEQKGSDVITGMEDRAVTISSKAQQAFASEKERQRRGGPLDQLGTRVEEGSLHESPPASTGGWTSFMNTRR